MGGLWGLVGAGMSVWCLCTLQANTYQGEHDGKKLCFVRHADRLCELKATALKVPVIGSLDLNERQAAERKVPVIWSQDLPTMRVDI